MTQVRPANKWKDRTDTHGAPFYVKPPGPTRDPRSGIGQARSRAEFFDRWIKERVEVKYGTGKKYTTPQLWADYMDYAEDHLTAETEYLAYGTHNSFGMALHHKFGKTGKVRTNGQSVWFNLEVPSADERIKAEEDRKMLISDMRHMDDRDEG